MKRALSLVLLLASAISLSGCIVAPYPGYYRPHPGWCFYHPYRCG